MTKRGTAKYLKYRQRLGKRIADLIQEKGYSSVENFTLSNGMHKATVHQIIRAEADPRLSTLLKVCESLEVSPENLILGLSKYGLK